jgi:starvation-inducible DNA-binding protein
MNLEQALKIALASIFCYYSKLHTSHFNVTGRNFYSDHLFLEKMYKSVWKSYDHLGEELRALDILCPSGFSRLNELSVIKDQSIVPIPVEMFEELAIDNEKIIEVLTIVNKLSSDHSGLQNFIQERIDEHSKFAWMLRSICHQHTV